MDVSKVQNPLANLPSYVQAMDYSPDSPFIMFKFTREGLGWNFHGKTIVNAWADFPEVIQVLSGSIIFGKESVVLSDATMFASTSFSTACGIDFSTSTSKSVCVQGRLSATYNHTHLVVSRNVQISVSESVRQ